MVLRNYACQLLYGFADENTRSKLLLEALELCILRYPMCKAIVLEYINTQLKNLDISEIDPNTVGTGREIYELLRKRIAEEASDRVSGGSSTTKEIIESVSRLTFYIVYTSLMATFDLFGIECPVREMIHGRGLSRRHS